ncbi:tryptophan dimethylallyltransferase-domain-containing protein [Biscogniauxia sp. FL1348]|nr:tryptophan dimethylallyltransferase-domain-containing protein [Biscogniauxia sp. FL1348]
MLSEIIPIKVLAVTVCLLLLYFLRGRSRTEYTRTIRYWPTFLPEFLDRLTYNDNAAYLVKKGYRNCKDQPFRLLKMDMNLIVIPLRYASELRAITSDKLDPLTASFDDNAGSVTRILLGSELHSDAIHRRLTPRLPQIIPIITAELTHAFDQILPRKDDTWVPVNPYEMVLDLSNRAAARVFVGESLCRDKNFLDTCASYSRNTFNTINTVRTFGHAIASVIGNRVSSVKHSREQLHYIQKLLGSEVERRRASPDEKQDDFLQWCMDLSRTEQEAQPEALAHRTLGILSMAVVHTTAMATTHILFDLLADRNLLELLRAEQKHILKLGWTGISQQAMLDMRHLDSLMRESQRVNPVGEFTFRRLVRENITLSDGYQLKPGQQIALPAKCLNMDDSIISDAQLFNPLRWAEQQPVSASFSHSSSTNLHFGLELDSMDFRYWTSHCVPPLISLMRSAGSYSNTDQEAQLRILSEHVLPNLGPRPSLANSPSLLTQSGSPIQLSLNTSSLDNCVRYCWEMLGRDGGTDSDPLAIEAAKTITSTLSLAFGFTRKWSNALLSAFAVDRNEAHDVVTRLPEWLTNFVPKGETAAPLKRIPFAFAAFDLKSANASVKLYVNPKAKEIVTGVPTTSTLWAVLRTLIPPLNSTAIDILEQFLARSPIPCPVELIGIDCVDETRLSDARVKIYVHTRSNSFNTVYNYVTLGGQLCDEETTKGLTILRSIWHLLLQENDESIDDDYEKPVNDSSMLCQKLYFSFELQPGKEFPRVKTYLPTWNYVRSDEETILNYEEAFRKCHHPWGEEGRYGKIFTDAFPPLGKEE